MPEDSRRAHNRVEYRTDVTITVGDRAVSGSSRNLSQGGMFIETSEAVPMGQAVRVSFTLPGLRDKPVDAEALVRWAEREGAQQFGVGVQFTGLRAIEVWAINQLFRKSSSGA